MQLGDLVSSDVDPGSKQYLLDDRIGHPFRWRTLGGATPDEIGRAFAHDLGATYCETEDGFETLVERMMAADPLREHRVMRS